MSLKLLSSSMLCLISLSSTAVRAADDIQAVPAQLTDARFINYLKETERPSPVPRMYRFRSSMTLLLELRGSSIAKWTRIGGIAIEEATDDKGTNLRLPNTYSSGRITDVANYRHKSEPDGQIVAYGCQFQLGSPKRDAKTIASLKGSLKVVVSETKTTEISMADLKQAIGKTIDNSTLEDFGISVSVKRFTENPHVDMELTLAGKHEALKKLFRFEIVEASGGRLSRATPFVPPPGNEFGPSVTMRTESSLPDGAKLKIIIETSSETKTVPIQASNLKLP